MLVGIEKVKGVIDDDIIMNSLLIIWLIEHLIPSQNGAPVLLSSQEYGMK